MRVRVCAEGFQSLIGRLVTDYSAASKHFLLAFQSLIGRLVTRGETPQFRRSELVSIPYR